MPTLSDISDRDEDEHDIVAEYENRDSDGDQVNADTNEDVGSDSEETTARKIDPTTSTKHVVRNPLPKLNTERLKGPKGIHTIEKYFEGFKFYGKGYEKVDLDRIMKRMEHWGHRLFPKFDFDDFLERLEKLGTKKDLQVFIKKYRQDMISADDMISQDNVDVEEDKEQDEPVDEFDLLIAEQIEKQKQAIQQSSMANTSINNEDTFNALLSQSNVTTNSQQPIDTTSTSPQLSDEVKERIERNRQQAIQRRLARLKEIEEAKRKKLETTEDNSSVTPNPNSENKECESNSQVIKISEDHEC